MDVTVPPGCASGSVVEFVDASGRALSAVVPDGLVEGDTFRVDLPVADYVDEILDALTEDKFASLLNAYVERECHKFLHGGAGEFSLEQTQVHDNYVRLYESRIESHLKRHGGVSSDAFLADLLAAEASAAGVKRVARQSLASSLLLVQDFEAFAKMCQQRALERS